jgi:hypothetical protein
MAVAAVVIAVTAAAAGAADVVAADFEPAAAEPGFFPDDVLSFAMATWFVTMTSARDMVCTTGHQVRIFPDTDDQQTKEKQKASITASSLRAQGRGPRGASFWCASQ